MINNLLAYYYYSSYSSYSSTAAIIAFSVIGGMALIACIVVFAIVLPCTKGKRKRRWKKFKGEVEARRNQFDSVLASQQFRGNIMYNCKHYFGRESVDVFAFCADVNSKKLAVGSFLENGRCMILDFEEITGFSIVDGKRNTVMDSFTIGGGGGYGFGFGGMASTTTTQSNFVSEMKLKIETKNVYEPYMVTMFTQSYNAGSNEYIDLMSNIEKMKSVMAKIIADNKQEK